MDTRQDSQLTGAERAVVEYSNAINAPENRHLSVAAESMQRSIRLAKGMLMVEGVRQFDSADVVAIATEIFKASNEG